MSKKMSKQYIIYKAENIFTGQSYVGATSKLLDERKQDHVYKANNNLGSSFQNAIGTYGIDSFNWEVIDTAIAIDELAEKESRYILEYDSFENGYNEDRGGGFKKTVYQYNPLTGELIGTFESLTDAANAVNAVKQNISDVCLNLHKTCKGCFWSYSSTFLVLPDERKKQVKQISKDGDLVACYESASEASRKTGISKTCITRCCRQEREHSGGFLWKYS